MFKKHMLLEEAARLRDPVAHNREMWKDVAGEHELIFGLDADGKPVRYKYGERFVITILAPPGSGKSVLGAQLAEQYALSKARRGIVVWDKQREYGLHREPVAENDVPSFYRKERFLPMGLTDMRALVPSIAAKEADMQGVEADVFPINLKQLRTEILPELVGDVWSAVFGVDAERSESFQMASLELLKSGVVNPKQLLAHELEYRTNLAAQRQGTLISNVFTMKLKSAVENGLFGRLKMNADGESTDEVIDSAFDVTRYFNDAPLPVVDLLMASTIFSDDPNVHKWNAYGLVLSALIHTALVKKAITPPLTVVEEFEVGLTPSARAVFSQGITKGARHGQSFLFSTQSPNQIPPDVRKELLGFSDVILATGLKHRTWLEALDEAGFPDALWLLEELDTSKRPAEWAAFFSKDNRVERFTPIGPLSNFLRRKQA